MREIVIHTTIKKDVPKKSGTLPNDPLWQVPLTLLQGGGNADVQRAEPVAGESVSDHILVYLYDAIPIS